MTQLQDLMSLFASRTGAVPVVWCSQCQQAMPEDHTRHLAS